MSLTHVPWLQYGVLSNQCRSANYISKILLTREIDLKYRPGVEAQLTRGHEGRALWWASRPVRVKEASRMLFMGLPCSGNPFHGEHLAQLAPESHVVFSSWEVIPHSVPLIKHIHSKLTCNRSLCVLFSQVQRLPLILFLRPPIKWERKLESKHSESPDLNLYPKTTRRGRLSLKELF